MTDFTSIARMIDLSAVQPDCSEADVRAVAAMCRKHNFICAFALPSFTPLLVELLKDRPDIHIGGTVGFPGGGTTTRSKVAEARELLEMGCNEIDMVINIGWVKSGKWADVAADIRAVVAAAGQTPVKVILECHYLTTEEIRQACEACATSGVAFVKTGTGWAPTGATLENVALMKQTVGNRCQVKAAGGVRDLATLMAMVERGVTRFGIGVKTAKTIFEGTGAGGAY